MTYFILNLFLLSFALYPISQKRGTVRTDNHCNRTLQQQGFLMISGLSLIKSAPKIQCPKKVTMSQTCAGMTVSLITLYSVTSVSYGHFVPQVQQLGTNRSQQRDPQQDILPRAPGKKACESVGERVLSMLLCLSSEMAELYRSSSHQCFGASTGTYFWYQ